MEGEGGEGEDAITGGLMGEGRVGVGEANKGERESIVLIY